MIVTDLLVDGIFAAFAGIGFGAISHPPKRAFLYIAILSAIGHALRYYLMNNLHVDIAAASFSASVVIGLTSLWFGRLSHCPITVLYIPALLPMVPGMYAYKTVFALMMFMQNFKNETLAGKYLQEMQSNAVVTVSTVFLLALGATLLIFVFPKKAYSMTRKK
jgi:uncharacterized membrane protein YjjB (DUF3815 family)